MVEVTPISLTNRSKVTNGTALFIDGVDGRSPWGRRFRDIYIQILDDCGGADRLSEGQKQLARRCAMLSIACEDLEAKAVASGELDPEKYGQLSDRLGRCLQRLGLERKARAEVPDLRAYLASKGPPAPAASPPARTAAPTTAAAAVPADDDDGPEAA